MNSRNYSYASHGIVKAGVVLLGSMVLYVEGTEGKGV